MQGWRDLNRVRGGGQDTRVHWQQLQVYVQRDCMFSLKAHDSQHPTHRLGTGGHCSAVQQASLPRATTCTGKPSRLVQTLHRPPLQHYDDMPRLIMRLHKLNFLRLDQCFCFRVCSFVFRLFQRNEYLFSFSWKSCNFKFRQCWTCFNRFRALLENIRSSCLISRGVDRPKSPRNLNSAPFKTKIQTLVWTLILPPHHAHAHAQAPAAVLR